jgi:ATP-dependent RNA helicase RhlE
MLFSELALDPHILKAVAAEGYETPTPIQQQAIPHVLLGGDLVAVAQTGTGKTAAFALPILHRLKHASKSAHTTGKRPIRVLVLAPTRELATQIADGFHNYGKGLGFTQSVIFGGVGQDAQNKALQRGMDILVATPGRLLDLMGQRLVDFKHLEVLVLDEADRMLDMGFIRDVNKIVAAVPVKRQTLLFSATMPDDIEALAQRILVKPARVAVTPPATTVEKIAQSVFFVEQRDKRALLAHLLKDPAVKRVLVFTRTKHGANRVAEGLEAVGAAAIHGNKSQGARERALDGFKRGTIRVLVATDIAARGIDIDGITHVIQLDLPEVPDQYVHRIGRTARAGAVGVAWAFCAADERGLLKDIERNIRMQIPVVTEHPFVSNGVPAPDMSDPRAHDGGRRQGGGGRGGQSRGGGGGGGGGRGSGGGGGGGGGGRRTGGGGGGRSGGGAGRSSAGSSSSSGGAGGGGGGTSSTPRPASRGRARSFGPGRR